MHKCIETTIVFIREKRLQMEIVLTGTITLRHYFLSHGSPDIEINSNVHHAERRNTKTVSNRARFPWTGILFAMSFLSHILLYYSVYSNCVVLIGFDARENNPYLSQVDQRHHKISSSYVLRFVLRIISRTNT